MIEIICEKKSYQSRKDAVKDIVGMNKKYKQQFRAYECDKCGSFHISTLHKHFLNKTRDTKYPIKVTDIHYEVKPKETKRIAKKLKQKNVNVATSKLISKEMAAKLKLLLSE